MRELLTNAVIGRGLIAFFWIFLVQLVHAQTLSTVNECDRLAASPRDIKRPNIQGVDFANLRAEPAIAACRAAVLVDPNNARLHFQYGRALDKANFGSSAFAAYRKAFDLGFTLAAFNMGAVLQVGNNGIKRDDKAAFAWYEYSALKGDDFGREAAADMLLAGAEGVPSNVERAAVYLRLLANGGNAKAAGKIADLIEGGKIAPSSPGEILDRSAIAAEQGVFSAAYRLAKFYKTQPSSPEIISKGLRYSSIAYRSTIDAKFNEEAGWPIYHGASFRLIVNFVSLGAKNPLPIADYKQNLLDFPEDMIKFTFNVNCLGVEVPFDFYIWQWTRDYSQIDGQVEWLSRNRGCAISPEIVKSFNDLFKIARDSNVSYPKLVVDSINMAKESKTAGAQTKSKPVISSLDKPPASNPSDKVLTSGQKAGLGVAGLVAAAACWYWSDGCKELAWEVTKQGARELVKRKPD